MPLKSTEGENVLLYRTNVLTKNANFKKITQRSMFLDRIWYLLSVFYKAKKTFLFWLEFWRKKPIFLIMRPWFSFRVCASSFSQESFLFSVVLGSWRINTLAIKCDKLSDNYKFCYRAVRTSLFLEKNQQNHWNFRKIWPFMSLFFWKCGPWPHLGWPTLL
jgi:hypothetical protein